MERDANTVRGRLIKTPAFQIPLFELILRSDGSRAIRIKKTGKKEIEELTLDRLLELIFEVDKEFYKQT